MLTLCHDMSTIDLATEPQSNDVICAHTQPQTESDDMTQEVLNSLLHVLMHQATVVGLRRDLDLHRKIIIVVVVWGVQFFLAKQTPLTNIAILFAHLNSFLDSSYPYALAIATVHVGLPVFSLVFVCQKKIK